MRYKNSPRFISYLTRNTLALILAGGRGVRLKHLTKWRAKPAVPFAGKFRIIDFSLSNCVNSGIRRIGVLTQYKSHSLNLHIQRGWGHFRGELREFVELLPAQQRIEEAWYSGTADSVYQNLDIIRTHSPDHVLILAGDHVYKMDYGTMLARHVDFNADVTVGCIEVPVDKASAFGVMAVDEEMCVNKFLEKPEFPESMPGREGYALCSMGIYIFNTGFLYEQLIRDADDPHSSHDFGKDILPSIIGRYRVCAYPFTDSDNRVQAYWRDVGTVDAFWESNLELTDVTPELNLYDEDWPIWTLQEQLPPAKFIFDEDKRRGTAIDSMISGGCILSGATVRRSLLFSNVSVNDYSEVESSVVLPDVTIGKHCRIRRAVIDRGCEIPDGTVIGEDPEEDQVKYYVSPNGVVLVIPEMLGQSLHHVR
ncbi:glucose-1-phosphate adenylyltransferase [Sedimenticola hydrogenitrophicus]|uniref:glucose-1-phosphate adenylyltransferase n=1 Tax=Sedimenticola hydrogenitrophicus TaxID=2967975 RepID=UPI0023AEAF8D|nr:glucose-1-phosphate adenylyltransferase [Sedimenticola hydrogenitrophicus]